MKILQISSAYIFFLRILLQLSQLLKISGQCAGLTVYLLRPVTFVRKPIKIKMK
jgi:hypothetical protein